MAKDEPILAANTASYNISNPAEVGTSGINFIGFNQDAGCFAVGLKNGFRVYNSDPLKESERMDFINLTQSGVGHVEMLFRTNFLGILGGGPNPMFPANKCCIWDDIKRKFVIEFEYPSDIKAIKLRYDRMVIVLELCIKVYSFEALPKLLFACDTGVNPMGICAVVHNAANPLMAFPDKKIGKVVIVDLTHYENETTEPITSFSAHQNPLSVIVFNATGTLMATSSAKGTLVRIFNPRTGSKLYELRRGTNSASIYSISFNQDSSMLSVTSDHDTVHVFKLLSSVTNFDKSNVTNSKENLSSNSRSTNKSTSTSVSQIRCMLSGKAKSVAAFSLSNPNSLIILDSNGSYLKYTFSEKMGSTPKREQCVNFLDYDDEHDKF